MRRRIMVTRLRRRMWGFVAAAAAAWAASACGPAGTAPQKPAPRYAAREFNSDVPMRVAAWVEPEAEWPNAYATWIRRTPSQTPLKVPPCHCWVVTPERLEDLPRVVEVIRREKVPGLIMPQEAGDADFARLTDAGLAHLKDLQQLREVRASDTRVTEAGVTELTKALPDVHVVR